MGSFGMPSLCCPKRALAHDAAPELGTQPQGDVSVLSALALKPIDDLRGVCIERNHIVDELAHIEPALPVST